MSAIEETFNPTALQRSDTISSTISVARPLPIISTKVTRVSQSHPRIEFETLYTDLKILLGHNWAIYHDALTRFIRGELSSAEFGDLTDNFLLATPATEHAHNVLICAVLHNTTRDLPDPGPAIWVSAATDKTVGTTITKPAITSDAAELRVKTEIMKLPPRDRRRIKTAATDKAEEEGPSLSRNSYEDFYQASKIKAPDTIPASAGGLTKTNWELEIKKRYAQPLFSETIEFPDANTIYSRMVPICYEESIGLGSTTQSAELVSIAAEIYVKDLLGAVFNKVRVNGPRYENGAGEGTMTGAYKKQLMKEEAELKNGKLQRSRDSGLLPVESKEAASRRPLAMADLKLASGVSPGLWTGMPLIGAQISEAFFDAEQDEWRAERLGDEAVLASMNSLSVTNGAEDEMDVDEDDCGWEGAGVADKETLGALLEDCLSVRA